MDTANEPKTAEVTSKSFMTSGIAGANIAEPVGLDSHSGVGLARYVRKASAAIIVIIENLVLVLKLSGLLGSSGPSQSTRYGSGSASSPAFSSKLSSIFRSMSSLRAKISF